jgi:hypothetical protein
MAHPMYLVSGTVAPQRRSALPLDDPVTRAELGTGQEREERRLGGRRRHREHGPTVPAGGVAEHKEPLETPPAG